MSSSLGAVDGVLVVVDVKEDFGTDKLPTQWKCCFADNPYQKAAIIRCTFRGPDKRRRLGKFYADSDVGIALLRCKGFSSVDGSAGLCDRATSSYIWVPDVDIPATFAIISLSAAFAWICLHVMNRQ